MIIVWDNGLYHEDHELQFIDIGNEAPGLIVRALQLVERDGRVLGATEQIVWERNGLTVSWPGYIAARCSTLDADHHSFKEHLSAVPTALLTALATHFLQSPEPQSDARKAILKESTWRNRPRGRRWRD